MPKIDKLLGIETYDQIVAGSVIQIRDVTLSNTKFGWTSVIYLQSKSKLNINHDVSLC